MPKMNIDSDKPKLSKSKINFLEVRRSLYVNTELSIQVPPPNIVWDLESISSRKHISIIGENPTHYAIMDPSHSDNMFPPSKSFDDNKIPKLDKIPPYA